MQSKAIWASWTPCYTFEYDMCSLLQFLNTPGYANDDAWNEDYSYEY